MNYSLALLFASVASVSIASAGPLELKGIRLRMSEASVMATHASASCGDEEFARLCYVGEVSLGGSAGSMIVSLLNDEVFFAMIRIDGSDFSKVVDALKVKYGKPTSDEVAEVQNRMGAAFENREVVWVQGDGALIATQRTSNLDKSSVALSSKSGMAELERRQKEKAAKAAKDL